MDKLRKLINRETALYLLFGVLTTAVNYVAFAACYSGLALRATTANAVAFVLAVAFAFVTNKLFVFESKSWALPALKREVPAFLGGRIFSFLLEQGGLWLASDVLGLQRYTLWRLDGVMLAKLALAVIVVALNYVFGRLIFRKK